MQAFKTNPQHDPKTTCLGIKVVSLRYGPLSNIPVFPVEYRFFPLTAAQLASARDTVPADQEHLGYYSIYYPNQDPVIESIYDYRGSPNVVTDPTPQWPYILGEALMENEVEITQGGIKTLMIIKAACTFNGPGGPLERFKCPRFDDAWGMTANDFFDWHKELGKIM